MPVTFVSTMLGTQEILLIVLVVLLLFGGTKIPQLMRGLGEGIRELRKASQDQPSPSSIDTASTRVEPRK